MKNRFLALAFLPLALACGGGGGDDPDPGGGGPPGGGNETVFYAQDIQPIFGNRRISISNLTRRSKKDGSKPTERTSRSIHSSVLNSRRAAL